MERYAKSHKTFKFDSDAACTCQFLAKSTDCIAPLGWSLEEYSVGNQLLIGFTLIPALILCDLGQVT